MNKKYKSPRLLIRVMKISMQQLFLCLIFCTFAHANTALSQDVLSETVTIQAENTQIKRVLSLIEKQVDYRFIYSSSAININKKVSLNVTNKKLEEVLNDLFKLIDIQYSVRDRRILLRNNNLSGATTSLNSNPI
jgi:type II secretory pathway component GspD/PulD (secretin)